MKNNYCLCLCTYYFALNLLRERSYVQLICLKSIPVIYMFNRSTIHDSFPKRILPKLIWILKTKLRARVCVRVRARACLYVYVWVCVCLYCVYACVYMFGLEFVFVRIFLLVCVCDNAWYVFYLCPFVYVCACVIKHNSLSKILQLYLTLMTLTASHLSCATDSYISSLVNRTRKKISNEINYTNETMEDCHIFIMCAKKLSCFYKIANPWQFTQILF